jgi:methyl-accepting chemotaxis protein
VVLLIIGVAVFLLINGAMNRLVEEDKKDRIDSEAQIISSDTDFISGLEVSNLLMGLPNLDPQDVVLAIMQQRINDFIRYANDRLKTSVEEGMLGAEALLLVQPSSNVPLPYPYAMAASEDDLTFVEVPDYVVESIDEGETYLFREEGIPEWGFEGEYLLTLTPVDNPLTADDFTFIAVKPFGEEIARIDDFYSSERNRATLILVLVMAGGIVLIFLITFFILRRMIYKQITEPIDELTGIAEEVMEGNLDVEIVVREGEEFETLKWPLRR